MKKSLSLVLAIAMVFSMFSSMAFAAEEKAAGEYLQEIGVITGDLSGNLNEDSTWTRQDVTVILSRLMGEEATAEETAKGHSFADVTDPFYDGYITWAQEEELFNGHSDVRFGYGESITNQQFLAVMLRALGYDVAYEDTIATAVELGLAAEGTDAEAEATRGSYYEVVVTTLHTENSAGVVLGEALGLLEPVAPETVEVSEVSISNLKQVVVEFNQDVTENEDVANKDNYSIADATVSDVEVDGNVAVVTFQAAFDQQAEKTFVVEKGILGEDEEFEVEFLDNEIPSALSAAVVGNDTIKVTFSEPIGAATKDDFEVADGDLYIKSITKANNDTEINVELYSTLEEGTVTIAVDNAVEDYAGFGVLKATLEAEVVEDDEAPVVVEYKDATPNGVTLVFNEDIEIQSSATNAKFYHTNSNNPANALPTVSGNELVLDFGTNNLPEGTAYVYIDKDTVNDLWDNKNAKISVEIEVTVDEEEPTVKEIKVKAQNQLEVAFSEDVAGVDIEDFTILKDGEEEENVITNATVSTGGDKVTLDLSKNLAGDYALVVEDLTDIADNEIESVTIEFTVDDLIKPLHSDFSAKLYKGSASGQMVKVSFGEEMATEGAYSVADKAKYIINGTSLADFDGDVSVKVVDNGKAVEIKVEHFHATNNPDGVNLTADANTTTERADDVVIARVADAAGNFTAAFEGVVDLQPSGTVDIDTVELTDKKTVKVKFDDLFTDFDGDDLIVFLNTAGTTVYDSGSDTNLAKSKIAVSEDGGKTVATITLAADYDTEVGNLRVGTVTDQDGATDTGQPYDTATTADDINTWNVYGERLTANQTVAAADKAAPTVTSVTYNETTGFIEVEFSENLDANFFSNAGANGFSISGGGELNITAGSAPDLDIVGDTVILQFVTGKNFTANTNVSYDGSFGLRDAANNKVASFSRTNPLD